VLKQVAGFRSYLIVDSGNGTITSIGMFDTKGSADAANICAREVVQKSGMAALLPNPPDITVGEVLSDAK